MQTISKNNLPDWLTLYQINRINNSPKKFTIIANDKVYCTNDLTRTLNYTIIRDFPKIKHSEILIIKN